MLWFRFPLACGFPSNGAIIVEAEITKFGGRRGLRWGTEWAEGGTDFTYAESTGGRSGGFSGFRRGRKDICYENVRNEEE